MSVGACYIQRKSGIFGIARAWAKRVRSAAACGLRESPIVKTNMRMSKRLLCCSYQRMEEACLVSAALRVSELYCFAISSMTQRLASPGVRHPCGAYVAFPGIQWPCVISTSPLAHAPPYWGIRLHRGAPVTRLFASASLPPATPTLPSPISGARPIDASVECVHASDVFMKIRYSLMRFGSAERLFHTGKNRPLGPLVAYRAQQRDPPFSTCCVWCGAQETAKGAADEDARRQDDACAAAHRQGGTVCPAAFRMHAHG